MTGHTPDKEIEKNRIIKAGGWITEEMYVPNYYVILCVLCYVYYICYFVINRETYVNKMYKMDLDDPIKQKIVSAATLLFFLCMCFIV